MLSYNLRVDYSLICIKRQIMTMKRILSKQMIARMAAVMTVTVMTLGSVCGCAAEQAVSTEGFEDIDTAIEAVEEAVTVAEDEHMAEAVPYVDDEASESGDEASADAAETEETEAESEEEFLPGYPTEADWKERHTGSVSYIWEPTVLVSIFVNEEEDFWTPEEKQVIKRNCDIAYGFVTDYMKENYDTDVELIYDWTEDPELSMDIRLFEDVPAYITTEEEKHFDELELQWVEDMHYRELCQKYETSSIGFLYLIPHEGCSYTSMHFTEDKDHIWNEGMLLYLQDMYSPTYEYETPTVFAHELLHLFGAEDFYASAEVFSKETYDTLAKECSDDIMLRTFTKVNGVYTTFPDEVYGVISPVTAYLLGVEDDKVIADLPELERNEAACFPGSVFDRPF